MKLIREEEFSKTYLIEHFDDLWVLSKYIIPKTILCSKTQRKVAINSGGSDKKKQVTKLIYVELLVKKVELSSHTLKILGEILNENEFTKVGAHHSLVYEIGESVEIKEDPLIQRSKYSTNLLENSLKSSKNKCIIVLCDVDSIVISKCSAYSIDILSEKSRLGSKKYFSTSNQKSGIDEMYELLQEFQLKDFETIVFAGPGVYKNNLANQYKKNNSHQSIHTIDAVDAQISTISTVLKEIVSQGYLSGIYQVESDKKVESFLELMYSSHDLHSSKVVYGYQEVVDKSSQGSVYEIILSSQRFDSIQEENSSFMVELERFGIEFFLIDSESKNGKIIDGLGGIVGFLRY